ncbi:hypothetical protein [Leptothoe sp. PORK10 BA2]|uniref:hypothetical protein n=1 Tax=Leptothoe sp. PORK10 BA2 TaxID=3110254 RepID=UPI002B21D055|nr:hypothetical protein [Leptothoe sp. PORK10 BA2]MEA5463930.1 hypothetical protein [Leptothoe sp. PORK10 BA2]
MSVIKKIIDPLPNEQVVAISPSPEAAPTADRQRPGRRRLNLFTGRALSHQNLQLEQTYRDTHLALLGQQRSPGVVEGLEATIIRRPVPTDAATDNPLNDLLLIEAGVGLSQQGEELRLAARHTVRLGDLPVYAPPEVLSGTDTTLGDGNSPLEPRRLGDSLQTLVNRGVTLPPAGIVLFQPITTESSGAEASSDPCHIDVAGLAFANRQLIEGSRLIFYAWPTEWLALPTLEAETGTAQTAAVNRWRSRLAYAIFRRELRDPMPWAERGVPIALLGFDLNWQGLFSDRHAVARQGGRAHHRAISVPDSGNPFLWQARIEQFAEQLGELDLSQIPPEQLADYFAWLPPVGGLPNYLVKNLALPAETASNPAVRSQLFFPTGYRVEAAPIPEEQLDLVFRESASLLPYDTVSNDASSQVKLLVPVPQKLYDPNLLKVESLDPEFTLTLNRFINRRAAVLHRRQLVRDRANRLQLAITGEPIPYPNPDPDQLETGEKAAPDAPFTSPSAHQSAIAQGLHEHGFTVASSAATFRLQAGDRLITYVYLDPDHPPSELMLTFQLGADSEHRAYWGAINPLIDRGLAGTTSHRRLGERPALDEWVRLEIPLDQVGLNPGNILTGMLFTLYNGRAAWGHTARLGSDGTEQIWVGTALPPGATEIAANEPWLWLMADERLTPFEERYALETQAGATVVAPIAALKLALQTNSPLDRDAVRLPRLATDAENTQLDALLNSLPADSPVKSDIVRRLLRIQGILSAAERDRLISLAANSPATVRTAFTNALGDLFQQSQDNTTLAILDDKGLAALIQELERLTNQADDQIEFGFLQVRTDMFRVRQFVLGNEEASRLSVSPTLSAIAQRDTAAAAQKDLSAFFNRIKTDTVPTASVSATEPGAPTDAGLLLTRFEAPTSFIRNAFTLERAEAEVVNPTVVSSSLFSSSGVRLAAEQPLLAQPALFNLDSAAVSRVGAFDLSNFVVEAPTTGLAGTFGLTREPLLGAQLSNTRLLEAQSSASKDLFSKQSEESIVQQSPLIGKVNPSITIAERLKEPPAPEARNYTLAGRVSVISNLASSNLFKDIPVPGGVDATFGQIKQRPGSIAVDPGDLPTTPDEAEYFSSSVRVLDNTVAALRLAEGRISDYRQAITQARQTLQAVQNLRQQADSRLAVIGGELAEARHDVSVARSLIAEEQQRLGEINQKRQNILATQVPFLVYHRPRTLGPDTDTPVRSLLPSVQLPARPACLNRQWPLPDALQEATDLLRRSPMGWFTHLPPLLNRFDRPEILFGAIQQATLTAQQSTASFNPGLQRLANQTANQTGLFAQSISRTFIAQQQTVSSYRLATAQLDLNPLLAASWQGLRDRATLSLSLGDLIHGKYARSGLSAAAAQEFEDLTRALGCLYAGFSAIRPILRLNWAERISQFDSPINLRNFSALPRWGDVDYLERRELQSVADWLYLRVSAQQAAAIALLNDLVRICILLASAAPVNQIIAGRIVEPTSVNKGGHISIAIDPARVRIGMNVLLYGGDNRIVAQGRVEDLSGDRAAARITQTATATVQLAANAQVRFMSIDNSGEVAQEQTAVQTAAVASPVELATNFSASFSANALNRFSSSSSGNFSGNLLR